MFLSLFNMTDSKVKPNELRLIISSLQHSFSLLKKNDPLRMAGATAFFTTFALPPIIFILAQLFGLFIGQKNMGSGLLKNISSTIGKEGAGQVKQVIKSIHGFSNNWYVLVFGFLFLVFISTTLFTVIKNSLDQIWQISVKERPGFIFILNVRARSFAVILLVGLLFFADLFLESLQVTAGNYFEEIVSWASPYLKSAFKQIASVTIVSTWFIFLFRFLADGRPSWKASVAGGLLTGILFTAGKLLLQFLLVKSNIGHVYGTSGSFVLVLLFVFYSSFILYYGACFIAVYSEKKQWPLLPNTKSFKYRIQKIKKPDQ